MAGKLGRLAPHPEDTHPRLHLSRFLTGQPTYPPAPSLVDYLSRVTDWPMYGNDQWGDCVWAMIGHIIEAATFYATGTAVQVTTEALLKGYSDVTGFDPNAGPSGANPTDQGTVIQDALNYWRKVGIRLPDGRLHKILAFAQVDHGSDTECDAALNLFGHLAVGIEFPASAMEQFDAGKPWDVVRGAHNEGGHAINQGLGRSAGNDEVVTWARRQQMTPRFAARYVEEKWVVILPEWVEANGSSPGGFDAAALNSAFTSMTGDPAPFPVQPQPGPPPVPVPPGPGPVVDPVDRAFLTALNEFTAAGERWRTAKGL
jgi:hypothetical protein